jgi:SAM-dependent methyltransferase
MITDENESWLQDWHDRHPGATSRSLARGKPSSYEWIAGHARPGDRALDLACGDGMLMDLLRRHGVSEVTGVDMSEGELAAARARLGGDAPLVQARAQALPFEDASFDLVTCHMALMLMDPVEQALSEVRRVLRPGGRFAAVVGLARAGGRENAWSCVSQKLGPKNLAPRRIGDPRTLREDGLRALLAPFSSARVEKLTIDLSGTPDEVWTFFTDLYTCEMMKPGELARLEQAVRADWKDLVRPDGTLPVFFGFFCMVAVR